MNWRSDRRSRLRRAAVVLAAVPGLALTGVALSSATPASASSTCPQYDLCTWQNAGGLEGTGGTQWNFAVTSSRPGNYWWYVGSGANDNISSIKNTHTATDAIFSANCPATVTGPGDLVVGPGGYEPNLQKVDQIGSLVDTWNDIISAWAVSNAQPAHPGASGGC